MKIISILFLVGLVAVASCLVIIPKRTQSISKSLLTFIILLAFTQLIIEGYYSQFKPGYLLLLLLVIRTLFSNKFRSRVQRGLVQWAIVLFILASIIPWAIFLPIPQLHEPKGSHKVGTRIFRWVDVDRAEPFTSAEHDKRNVVVQAWYPTQQTGKETHSNYLDGLGNLPPKIGIIPSWIFDRYNQINTYGTLDAAISRKQNYWPVIIFLTGNGASRSFYTSLVAGLASHGYVVLAIDHPYEAMITQLADGKIATTIEKHQADDPDLLKFMKDRLDLRIADVKFVLNQLDETEATADNFLSSLDKNRIVIAGHSFGGASAGIYPLGLVLCSLFIFRFLSNKGH